MSKPTKKGKIRPKAWDIENEPLIEDEGWETRIYGKSGPPSVEDELKGY
jgi:hypothetical protein